MILELAERIDSEGAQLDSDFDWMVGRMHFLDRVFAWINRDREVIC